MSGLEFLKELRSIPEYQGVPFVFVTAQAEKERVIEALRAGAQDYIVKPASPPLLREKLERLTSSSASRMP
jgi:two-component system chemotaxis response regulator CheY